MKTLRCLLLILLAMIVVPRARAHVGSKDVFETVSSGQYKLFVTIRMPTVIPGGGGGRGAVDGRAGDGAAHYADADDG
jgi:hypothetical protein